MAGGPEIGIPVMIATTVASLVAQTADAIPEMTRAIDSFAETTNRANRSLLQYSGALQTAYALQMMADWSRQISLAHHTGPTAETLARSVTEMRDAVYPFTVMQRTAQNQLANAGSGFIAGLGETLGVIPELLVGLNEKLDPSGEGAKAFGETAGTIIGTAILGPILPLLLAIKDRLGIKDLKPIPIAADPWGHMIRHEAEGPGRRGPINGFRPFNPGRPL